MANHEHLTFIRNGEKVRCTLTKHDVVADLEAVKKHLKSKSYKKAMWYAHDYSKYEPYIVAHKRDSKKLYCTMTKMTLNKIPDQIEKHYNGKKFKRRRKEFEEKQKEKKEREKRRAEKRKRRLEARESGKDKGLLLSSSSSSSSDVDDDDSGSDSDSDSDTSSPRAKKKQKSLLFVKKKKK